MKTSGVMQTLPPTSKVTIMPKVLKKMMAVKFHITSYHVAAVKRGFMGIKKLNFFRSGQICSEDWN